MENRHITSTQVRKICGNVSDMTIWRWLQDSSIAFPKPKYINRRRYWRETDLTEWLEARDQSA